MEIVEMPVLVVLTPSLSIMPPFIRIYLTVLAALLGLVMGSALHCLAWRIVHNEKWSGGRSRCPECGHTLGLPDLVPLFSWLFLKGKCRYCKEPIPVRYPLSELILGIAFTALLWRFDLSIDTLIYTVLVCCLFALSIVDLDIQIIPDRFWIIPAVIRVVQVTVKGGLSGLWHSFYPALILGGGVLLLVLFMDKILKKESMGGGDIKLLFMLGLYFDLPCCLLLLILACIVGLIAAAILTKAKKDTPFPFGPAISIAGFFTLMFGEFITGWYMGLFA